LLRLFFALQPTSTQATDLLARASPPVTLLQGQGVPPGNLHATLCFVGAVAPEKLDALKAAAAGVRCPVVELRFDALDFWSKPGILCATAPDRRESQVLARILTAAIISAGFSPDQKPFRAHLTLARKVSAAAAQLEWPSPLAPAMEMRCDRFVLMQSRREESGSVYSVVDSWPLDADKPLPNPSE
jgi:RNA 2',3'-cyclic 3'-phosphodiesterase